MILAELANSKHSSTLGVATLVEFLLISLLKYKYQDNLHLFLLQVSATPYSVLMFAHLRVTGVAMMADSNFKYPEVFRIHGNTIIGASVARPPLGVERQLFYIFIYYFIYLFIYILYIYILWCCGHPGYRDILALLASCNEEGVAQCCMLALSTITYLARYTEVHSVLQPAGEAARYVYS